MSNFKYQFDANNEKSYGDFLEKQKQKRKKKQVVSSSAQSVEVEGGEATLDPVPSGRGKGKRNVMSEEPAWTDRSVHLSIPANSSIHTGYEALSGQLGQLLLEEDKTRLTNIGTSKMFRMACGHSFMAYQHSLFMMNTLENGEKRVAELEKERSMLRREMGKAHEKWSSLESILREQLASKNDELRAAKASMAEMKDEMARMEASSKEELEEACVNTLICSRGRMAEQFLAGQTDQWDTSAWVAEYKEYESIYKSGATSDGGDGLNSGGDVGGE